jgi:glycosyltransferase involved in cell wall biosynthesis
VRAKYHLHRVLTPGLSAFAPSRTARVSAMVRVKNEEDFLRAGLESIIDVVDEIVVVDNLSTDSTLEIATKFRDEHPESVRVLSYPHQIARQGSESTNLAGSRAARRSPQSLATFYNWCMDACRGPYILKWDGDMVATVELERAMAEFRADSSKQALWFGGANVHPDMTHQLAGEYASAPVEARLFPKRFANHTLSAGRYEVLHSPYKHGRFGLFWTEPAYLHLQMCRSAPLDNRSSELQERRSSWDYETGALLTDDMLDAIKRYDVVARCPRP